MMQLARKMIGRLLGGALGFQNRMAHELGGMDSRELCDLGIGASEIPYILDGGRRDHQSEAHCRVR